MNILQKFSIFLVRWYQQILSPDHSFWAKKMNRPPYCKHIPSCSEYMIEAIEKKGFFLGVCKGCLRILRCNPWSKGGYDSVEKSCKLHTYDHTKTSRFFSKNTYHHAMIPTIHICSDDIDSIDTLGSVLLTKLADDGVTCTDSDFASIVNKMQSLKYHINIDNFSALLRIFLCNASHVFAEKGHQNTNEMIGKSFFDLCDISIPDSLVMHHEIGHFLGYKTRVLASFFTSLNHKDDISTLQEIYTFSQKYTLPLYIIGGGTNMLFADEYFPGIIVKNNLTGWHYDAMKKELETKSNEMIWDIAQELETVHQQPLWHRFIGLPGSIGGAIVGNAGCFGLETSSNFVQANVFDMRDGSYQTLSKQDMNFGYRDSFLKHHSYLFLISAQFDLSKKIEKYHSEIDNIDFRTNKQPRGNSCGSFFKNPDRDHSAGSLIEQVGLRGYRHGGARWSDIHANFLLADDTYCTSRDLIELVQMTQKKVKNETGFSLINEVKIIQ